MGHDTHHDTHHTVSERTQSTTSFGSAFFFVLILAGLFIAAVNFVNVMGHDDEGGHDSGHTTEHAAPAHGGGHGSADAGHNTEAVSGHEAAPAGDTHAADTTHAAGH